GAEKKTRGIELERSLSESGEGGRGSPGDHGDRDRSAGAPSFDEQSTRDLEGDVADEENSDGEAGHCVAETEVTAHTDGGIGEAGAIEIVGDVENEEEREEAEGGLVSRAAYKLLSRRE